MEMEVLKKKVSTFRSEGGKLRISDDQLYLEILSAWEQWTGSSKEFYKAIGVSKTGLAGVIGKAKRMRREGHFPVEEFKEIKVAESPMMSGNFSGVEIVWESGKLIRFQQVDQLIDFLKKVA